MPQAVPEPGIVEMEQEGSCTADVQVQKIGCLLRFLGGGSRIKLSCCPSRVTLDVGCQAGWTAVPAACPAPVVHDKVDMVAQAVFPQL